MKDDREQDRRLRDHEDINLIFGRFQALKNVCVDFDAGELVGLVGDNGAGKTTLIRMLCGMHKPTSGKVFFDGREITNFHPKLAIELGIETIQQAVGLCENLTIARNFYLGREPVKRFLGFPLLDFEKMRAKSRKVIRAFGLRSTSRPMTRSVFSRVESASRSRSAVPSPSRTGSSSWTSRRTICRFASAST